MFSSRSVQIAAVFSDVFGQALPNLCRSFYNETKAEIFFSVFAVALLAEGVDRNRRGVADRFGGWSSPSSRRAWIEICIRSTSAEGRHVALLAEGVDRNSNCASEAYPAGLRSPSSRRAWIEIPSRPRSPRRCGVALLAEGVDRNWPWPIESEVHCCRPPRGGRG